MAEVEKIVFEYREVVEALVKKENIHEGFWALYIEFGISAANIGDRLGDSDSSDAPSIVTPAAIIPVQKIGIMKTDHLTNISVDAAKVNPRPKQTSKQSRALSSKK